MSESKEKITIQVPVTDLITSVQGLLDVNKPLNKRQASEALGVSVPTIDRLMAKSAIPFHRVGRRVVFLQGELIDWLKSKNVMYGKSV